MKLILAIFCIALVVNFIIGDPIGLRSFGYDAYLHARFLAQGIFHSVHR